MSRGRDKADRQERIPFGVPRRQLNVNARDGYVGRWFNDVDDRLQRARAAGYELRDDPNLKAGDTNVVDNTGLGSALSKNVGTKKDGTPMTAYYMELPKELYDADQKAKQEQIQLTEDAIRNVGDPTGRQDEHIYGAASITHNTR